ncbi:MAG: signal peptidase I [Solirubrobacterales bacterium]
MIPRPTTGKGAFLELILIVAMAIGLALVIQAFGVKPYQIPSASMEPTLDVGQRVLVNRVTYHFSDPDRGDIVVFHPPEGAEKGKRCGAESANDGDTDSDEATFNPSTQACPKPTEEATETNFIKRVVAVGGDRLRIEDGHPVVNGEAATEDFIKPCKGGNGCNLPEEIVIPPDHYFMMGDNRGSSDDSRFWGPVPREDIIGQAFFTYWPPDRIGIL